ncbi:M1 family metallopeptidase [Pseudonocardia spinosispora]|uniref:M1 family metallopeptidase n=1 Tax=Pseudonocardia spinosispora TaxID=103441 RepID=UPI00146FA259|nr:M1 family metallopeptidase [Pseudonocardia spinosispora]
MAGVGIGYQWHAADSPEPPMPAAAGIGDPYFPPAGNSGYDVTGYEIQLRYDPPTGRLDGRTTVNALPTENRAEFALDLRLPATQVTVNNQLARFHQDRGKLLFSPTRPVPTGRPMVVQVTYGGVPSEVRDDLGHDPPWTRTVDGAVIAGEPEGAAWWFPANDHPSDKATVAVTVTVPAGLQAISNGKLLAGPEPAEPGWQRWRWRASAPMATYLAFVAIGHYDIVTRDTPYGPYIAAFQDGLDPLTATVARAAVEQTPQIVGVLSGIFGPYPFDTIGGVVPDACAQQSALETQTRPVYGPQMFRAGADVSVVVHELAHQWFGDTVSVHRWSDIWLNEGFASYAVWLYRERTGGPSAKQIADQTYLCNFANTDFWRVPPGDPGPDELFNSAVYSRGAMALEALRTRVGDDAFFTGLRTWVTERQGHNGTVADFLALLERISGKKVDDVAQTWLFAPVRPSTPPG